MRGHTATGAGAGHARPAQPPPARAPLARRRFAIIRGRFFPGLDHMIETNPIHARIADLKDRVASLRGYL